MIYNSPLDIPYGWTEPSWVMILFYAGFTASLFILGYFQFKLKEELAQVEFLPLPPRPDPGPRRGLKDLDRKEFMALMFGLGLCFSLWGYSFYLNTWGPEPLEVKEVTFFEVIDQPWATRWDLIYTYGDWFFYLEGDWSWVPQNTTLIMEVRLRRSTSNVPSYYVESWRYKNE